MISAPEIGAWGWRIPFVDRLPDHSVLCFILRRSLAETEAFLQRKHRLTTRRDLRVHCAATGPSSCWV